MYATEHQLILSMIAEEPTKKKLSNGLLKKKALSVDKERVGIG